MTTQAEHEVAAALAREHTIGQAIMRLRQLGYEAHPAILRDLLALDRAEAVRVAVENEVHDYAVVAVDWFIRAFPDSEIDPGPAVEDLESALCARAEGSSERGEATPGPERCNCGTDGLVGIQCRRHPGTPSKTGEKERG